jgi:gamma-tubulin complex component 2
LFFIKNIERLVSKTWKSQSFKFLGRLPEFRGAFVFSLGLRQRMMHFIQNFMNHVMIEVLEPRWHQLEQDLKNAETVDVVKTLHNSFLDVCLRECLLTNLPQLTMLTELLETCKKFGKGMQRFALAIQTQSNVTSFRTQNKSAPLSSNLSKSLQFMTDKSKDAQSKYVELITQLSQEFDQQLAGFVSQLRDKSVAHYAHHMAKLYTRLDFSGYYAGKLSEQAQTTTPAAEEGGVVVAAPL